jgi:hypothetical protein
LQGRRQRFQACVGQGVVGRCQGGRFSVGHVVVNPTSKGAKLRQPPLYRAGYNQDIGLRTSRS